MVSSKEGIVCLEVVHEDPPAREMEPHLAPHQTRPLETTGLANSIRRMNGTIKQDRPKVQKTGKTIGEL